MLQQGIKVDNLLPPPARGPDLSIESLIEQSGSKAKEQEEQSLIPFPTISSKLKEVYLSAHPLAKG